MSKYLEVLYKMKKASGIDRQTLANLLDNKLTCVQIKSIFEGDVELGTKENLALLEDTILKVYLLPIERLKTKMIEIKTFSSSVPNRLDS